MGMIGVPYIARRSTSLNDNWERSGMREYVVAFTQDVDEVQVRMALSSTFNINLPHPSDSGQVIVNIAVEQIEEPSLFADPTNPGSTSLNTACYWWKVTTDYGPWDPLQHSVTGNPVDQPIDFSFQWQIFEQPVDVAWNPATSAFVPVVNSAGDPFDPGVTREQLKGVMRVAWNSLVFNPSTSFANGNLINEDVWNGFPQYTIKFTPPAMPQRLYSQFLGQNYYRLEGEFAFNPNDNGWNAMPIDRGFRALNGSSVPYKIFDVNGQPISQPALLNGSGGVLPFASLSSFVQFDFQIYNSITFATAFPNLTNLF